MSAGVPDSQPPRPRTGVIILIVVMLVLVPVTVNIAATMYVQRRAMGALGEPGQNPGPAEPFGDFILTQRIAGSIWSELRVFTDGAAVLVSVGDATGGMVEPATMGRLRSLLGSAEFHRDLTRPPDDIERDVCGGTEAWRDTFRMGGLVAKLPCTNHDRPTLDEFERLLDPYRHGDEFPAELPGGQPDLPPITVHEELDGEPAGSRYEVRPNGRVTVTDNTGQVKDLTLETSAVDALRLMFRSEPCVSRQPPSMSLVYVVQVQDRDPVTVSQFSGELFDDCADYHSIARLIVG